MLNDQWRLIPRCLPGLRHGESRTRHTCACAGGAGGAGRRPTWPGEGWGKRPKGENAGGFFLELGKMDWSFFFWVGILAYVQFLSLALGWYMKLVHLVLGESFFMDFRDGWISFISNNRGANPKWDTMESHWNSFCSVVSFCFPYALRWFQVMSLAWAKSPATDP